MLPSRCSACSQCNICAAVSDAQLVPIPQGHSCRCTTCSRSDARWCLCTLQRHPQRAYEAECSKESCIIVCTRFLSILSHVESKASLTHRDSAHMSRCALLKAVRKVSVCFLLTSCLETCKTTDDSLQEVQSRRDHNQPWQQLQVLRRLLETSSLMQRSRYPSLLGVFSVCQRCSPAALPHMHSVWP